MLSGRILLTLMLFASNAKHLMGTEEEGNDKSSQQERKNKEADRDGGRTYWHQKGGEL